MWSRSSAPLAARSHVGHRHRGEWQTASRAGAAAIASSSLLAHTLPLPRLLALQYDLNVGTFSPDGRVFQTEYAQKAVDGSGCGGGRSGGGGWGSLGGMAASLLACMRCPCCLDAT